MILIKYLSFSIRVLLYLSSVNAYSGILYGNVKDANTGRPIIECRVKIIPADTLIYSDSSGHFKLEGLLPGVYRAVFIKSGFETVENSNVIVGTGSPEEVVAQMSPRVGELILELSDRHILSPDNNFKTAKKQTAGKFQYGRNDVLRSPGALQDISLFAQSLPGVMRTNDQKTDLSVRGVNSNENAYLIDGIPIFNINHFENNAKSGGGIGNINTYFLENVDFHTGAFSARYPDRLSSVMDISFKRGNSGEASGLAILDAAGMGGLLEGPIPGSAGTGTYGLSMRVSSLSMLDELGLIKFGGVPKYGNGHLKVNQSILKWDISLNILGGKDGFDSEYPSSVHTVTRPDTAKYRLQEFDYQSTDNLFGGMRATRLFAASRLSLYTAGNTRNFHLNSAQKMQLLSGGPGARIKSEARQAQKSGGSRALLGMDWDYFVSPTWTIRLGGLEEYDQAEMKKSESLQTKKSDGVDSSAELNQKLTDQYYTLGLYGEAEIKREKWGAIGGLRILKDEYSNRIFFGPRASLDRTLGNQTLRAAVGIHSQSQAGELLSQGVPAGTTELPFNIQTLLGWDGNHSWGLSTRLEFFDKQGFRILRFRPDGSARDTGKTVSRGVDIYIRKSLKNRAWGSAAYTYAWNRDEQGGKWVSNAYSIPHSLSMALGYDLGRSLTTSIHLGFASGAPFSLPPAADSTTTSGFAPVKHYAEYHDPYFRLDTRIEYRYAFSKATLGTFLEITNITDHVNLFTLKEYEIVPGWGFFPVGGFTLSF